MTRGLSASAVAVLLLGGCVADRAPVLPVPAGSPAATVQPRLGTRSIPLLVQQGLRFRDLDRDGRLSPYEDWRRPDAARVADLLGRMTLEEKVGTLLHGNLPGLGSARVGDSSQGYDLAALRAPLLTQHVTSFITRLSVSPQVMAEQNDAVQALAEGGRLGIPVTISTDPRHHFQYVLGASSTANGWSQWPEPLGFAALRDPALVKHFATIAGREYRATGLHQALSPQADLFTEPRWARGTATFGADPALVSRLAGAYVEGFQGGADGLAREGVLAVVKHWVAYGATPSGWDGHNFYGRNARVDAASFALHTRAFEDALRVRVGGVMPTYSIVQGADVGALALEPVGAGFSRQLLTTLLRGRFGFDGIVLSDWAITNDCNADCRDPQTPQTPAAIAMPWGVESLTKVERFAKGLDAGIDQFGGTDDPQFLLAAVRSGRIGEARIDESVRRVLLPKFRMGLFEDPYVDPAAAAATVGTLDVMREAQATQAASFVRLQDRGSVRVRPGQRVYLHGVDRKLAAARGLRVVDDPAVADVAVLRIATPFERLHPNHFFGSRQNEGRLDFRIGDPDYDELRRMPRGVKVVVALFLDRPAVLGDVPDRCDVLLAHFGASDEALLDVVTGAVPARGRLPFELPASMAAVEAQDPAQPDDTASPRFRAGAGLPP